jgi:hypothetical protein
MPAAPSRGRTPLTGSGAASHRMARWVTAHLGRLHAAGVSPWRRRRGPPESGRLR